MVIPFPFFGSGDAEYFEFASLSIVFQNPVSTASLARILEDAPPPFLDDEDPQPDGRILHLSGGQMSHVWIAQHYEPDEGEEPDFEGRFPFAATSQVRKFNRHVERWLKGLDGVDFALRAPDWEAGGTEYDDWHNESLKSVLEVMERFGEEDEWIAEGLADFAREAGHDIPEPVEPFEASVLSALDAGDSGALSAAIAAADSDDTGYYKAFDTAFDADNPDHRRALLEMEPPGNWLEFPNLYRPRAIAAALEGDGAAEQVLTAVGREAVKTPFVAISLAGTAQELAEATRPEAAWRILDQLVVVPDVHPAVLEIALYALGEWVTDAPVPVERAEHYVGIASPRVSEHPRLHLYLACIAEETGDQAEAERQVQQALDAGIEHATIKEEAPLRTTLTRL